MKKYIMIKNLMKKDHNYLMINEFNEFCFFNFYFFKNKLRNFFKKLVLN